MGRPIGAGDKKVRARRVFGSLAERFWSKVNKDGPAHPYDETFGPCWIWTAGLAIRGGYGQIRLENGKAGKAPRVALELAGAAGDFHACHGCDNPKCVRVSPGHVYAGTRASNMSEMAARLRTGPQKLTVDEVVSARRRLEKGDRVADIARDLGVSRGTIGFIRSGTSWRHLK